MQSARQNSGESLSPPASPEDQDCRAARLRALDSLRVLDTPSEGAFDEITQLASWICGTPTSLLSLVAADRQRFKASTGFVADEMPLAASFCRHVVERGEMLVVNDTHGDPHFRDRTAAQASPEFRFYAGAPVLSPDGVEIGALCVLDREPRALSEGQLQALRTLARQVGVLLALRRESAQLDRAAELLRASERRFRTFMDNSPTCAYMKDPEGRYLYINQMAAERFNLPASAWLGRTDFDLWPRDQAQVIAQHDSTVLRTGHTATFVEQLNTPEGSSYWRSFKFCVPDVDGHRNLAGMSVEVTQERHIEEALRASEENFRNLVERLADAVFLVDVNSKRLFEPNHATVQMFGYSAEELATLSIYELSVHDRESVDTNIAHILEQGRFAVGRRKYRRKDGTLIDVELNASVIGRNGRQMFSVVARDVTEQRRYEERLSAFSRELQRKNTELHALAVTDGLTRVGNRTAFNQRLVDEVARAAGGDHTLALLLLDVDHFKQFNDRFGHPAGDEVLKAIARLLQKSARNSDLVARYGGEEFALLCPDTELPGAVVLAERCRQAVERFEWPLQPVTISIGVATMPPVRDATALVAATDAALYQSKHAGRNRVTMAE